jgi:CxxC-x17-CxxC domain-containing protein
MLFRKRIPPKRFRARRKRHEITCAECGRKDSVRFHPRGTAPVLCSRCHRKRMRAKSGLAGKA